MSEPGRPAGAAHHHRGRACRRPRVKIVAPWSDETLPLGEQGELCARGYLVMKGYDEDPEATAAPSTPTAGCTRATWPSCAPTATSSFTGRAKETIIRGGENIYPREVEEFLHTHPKIADVYVVGLPDARLGETVLAWVRLKAGGANDRGRAARLLPGHASPTSRFPSTSGSSMPSR